MGAMETLGLAPKGTQKAAGNLSVAAESLVGGAQVSEVYLDLYIDSC